MNVGNTISMQNRMSPVIGQIISSMETAITVMERLDDGSERVGKADWSQLRSEVSYANRQFEEMERQVKEVNEAQNNTKRGFGGWAGIVTGINQGLQLTRSIASGIGNIMRKNDTLTLTNARLALINDGLRTQKQLQNEIFAAAERSRAKYEDIANLVSKVTMNAPGVFQDNVQAISFAETFNKMLKVSGAESSEASSATLQLTQALSSGRLQGDEFRSITENAPMLQTLLAETMGVGIGKLKELGSQGAITSNVIVRAMENGAENIEAMFANIPMTFGDRMTAIANIVGKRLSQVANSGAFNVINQKLQQFHMWLASPEGERTITIIAGGFTVIANTIGFVVSSVGQFLNLLFNVPGILETITFLLAAIATTIGIRIIPQIWAAIGATIVQIKTEWMHIAAILTKQTMIVKTTASVWAQAAAWLAVNWPILLVVAAVFGLLVAILKFPQVLGFIVGAFTAAFGHIYNVIAFIHNIWATFTEFFVNAFNHPVYSVKKMFVGLADSILSIIKSIATAIDAVFGSSLAGGITSLQGNMNKWLGEMPEGYKVVQRLEMKDIANEAAWGNKIGTGWGNSMKNSLNGLKDKYFNLNDNIPENNFKNPYGDTNITGGEIDKVGKIGSEVNIAKEDLKYLLDASTRQFVNKISVEQTAPVDVNINLGGGATEAEAKHVADVIKKVLAEQAAGSTVGVYST